jgi:hypothetical protein
MDVHLTVFDFAPFSGAVHSCHAIGGEFQWEKHALTIKTESQYELLCGTGCLMSLALNVKLSHE